MYYYEVVLPTLNSPIKNEFTYSADAKLNLGDFVEVPLKSKNYRGIVTKKVTAPKFNCKPINQVLIPELLSEWQIDLYHYINNYYFANPAKTIHLFLPNKILKNKKIDLGAKSESNSFLDILKHKCANKHELNDEQKSTLNNVRDDKEKIHLIHGVTGSGKTEIYLQLIEETVHKGHQVLMLVPEISLTPQTANYFSNYFGKEVVSIYHSGLNLSEQMLEWTKIRNNQAKIIIGSRSSLFLPYQNLEFIIMDEEHEFAYKQEQNPRYHARNIVQWYHQTLNTKVILGSATPSFESYAAAKSNKVNYHELKQRAKKTPLPKIEIIDLKDEYKNKNYSLISERLQEEISTHLKNNEQIMILHNKRGFANFLQCQDCGQAIDCPRCSISLTLHKYSGQDILQCHYCDYQQTNPQTCENCHGHNFKNLGIGIQRVIEELQTLFPIARILQADSDTTSTKHSFTEIYQAFKNHEADILIGTQMISKGISIPNVQLAAVINADVGLHLPDFRAAERSFQLLTQLSGRAGRNIKQGHVIIQTLSPEHPVINAVKHNNLEEFYENELNLRQEFNYPPFSKLTKLTFSNASKDKLKKAVTNLENQIQKLGYQFKSAPALIEKRHNKFYHNILIESLQPEKLINKLDLELGWTIDRDPISAI